MSAESPPTFDQLSDPAFPRIPLVVHVPHCATAVPPRYRDELVISDDELARELLLMTDYYTDELAMSAVAMGGVVFRNRVGRPVMDPERFEDDVNEAMAKRGMGAVYLRRHDGTPLRAAGYSAAQRANVMADLYTPYHRALEELVTRNLDEHCMCFLVDCHSFPSRALPYEDAGGARGAVRGRAAPSKAAASGGSGEDSQARNMKSVAMTRRGPPYFTSGRYACRR